MFASSNASEEFIIEHQYLWFILSLQAGWINAGGFLACHRFVSHITGFATQFGSDIAFFKWQEAWGMLTVPLFFIAGSMISAFYVDRRLKQKKQAEFHFLLLLMSFFLAAVTILGSIGAFGIFGAELDLVSHYVLVSLLCLTSGIQNAGTSTATKRMIRTTHLTGVATDLGIGIVRLLSEKDKSLKKEELDMNNVRMLLIISFILGSAIASFAFLKWNYLGFIFPCLISFTLFILIKKRGSLYNA